MSDRVLDAPVVLPRALIAPMVSRRKVARVPVSDWIISNVSMMGGVVRSRRAMRCGIAGAARATQFDTCSAADLDRLRETVAMKLRRDAKSRAHQIEALAIASQNASRHLGMTPFCQQLAAASALLRGEAAEMDTGEGKTLMAFLAASVYALGGRHVHVVTANDYLASRDAELLRPAFAGMGQSIGVVTGSSSPQERREAHQADVVFMSNKEAAFDYLRDRLNRVAFSGNPNLSAKLGRVLGRAAQSGHIQRALDVAIVDEIDSVLVDDAGTPLVISAPAENHVDVETARTALKMAEAFEAGIDFIIDTHSGNPSLTPRGLQRLERETRGFGGEWGGRLKRQELMRAALSAQHTLQRGRHYLIQDGKIVLVDQYSGRAMPDRHWSFGLNMMVEVKEGCVSTGLRKSLASISFQRFFRGYATICGMSGTVREVAREIHTVYDLTYTPIPRRLRLRRVVAARNLFPDRDELWSRAASEVAGLHRRGQPVLVAVRSVIEAERASKALAAADVPHTVLSAAQNETEAEIVSRAGQIGAVTVATNMAGRGTDIRLGEGVADLGGLMVMICERHDSGRVDRQLMGRCARQGDPGQVIEYVSLQDDVLRAIGPWWQRAMAAAPGLAGLAFRRAQGILERKSAAARITLMKRDEHLARLTAFAGGLD